MNPRQNNYRPQRVVAKVIFLHLSVILFTGGGLPQCMVGYLPEQTPPSREQTPPLSRHPPKQTPPGADSPPGADTHPGKQTPAYGLQAGRYASYWNAFLLQTCFTSQWRIRTDGFVLGTCAPLDPISFIPMRYLPIWRSCLCGRHPPSGKSLIYVS